MADSNTDSAPQSDGTSADHGSEFSKGTGAEDAAIWDKHFGKGDGGKAESSSRGERSPKPTKPSDKPRSESTRADSDGKSNKPSTPKEPRSTKAESSDSSKGKDKTSGKSERSESKPGDEPAGGKKAEDDSEPADPEAPLKKARDLYKQAQKTEDRREARKLYKRAMVEAFGELPEEFDDRRYAAVRTERAAAKAALDEQAKKNESRIQEAAGRLKPAIYVMRQLEGAGLGDKLTVPMVEKAIHVMKALRSLEDGDFTQLAEVVSRAAGVDHDTAMQRFVKGVKVSPEGKAARAAAEQAQRENQALKERLQLLETKLTERDTEKTEAEKKQAREQAQTQARERYLDDIRESLDGHAVLKLPRGAERVMAYQIRHADPKLKSARYSHQAVADKIVRSERRRLEAGRHLLDTEGQEVPSRPETPRRSGGSVPRAETVDSGVRDESGDAAFERIFEKHRAVGGGRRR